jgi:enoyl-CoA hydratase/carnithine racemase
MTTAQPFTLHRDTDGEFAGIITIKLEQPGKPVVVLDLELIQRLEATLKSIPRDCRGLVLASASERVFVAGADLKTISEASDDQLHRYLEYGSRVFCMLGTMHCPTVAAINGAALGGGLELPMHCDAMVAAPPAPRDGNPGKPYPVGLPEAGLGLCPGWGGTNLLPAWESDPAAAIQRTILGKAMLFDEAVASGLFTAVAPSQADLLPTAKRWLVQAAKDGYPKHKGEFEPWQQDPAQANKTLAALNKLRAELTVSDQTHAVFDALHAGLTQGYHAALAVERRYLVQLRHTPAAKTALAAFFAKSK